MQYNCHDIEKILTSSAYDAIDQAAFWAHIEACPFCGQLGLLEPEAEKVLGSLLPSSAPDSISRNVMRAVRIESENSYALSFANRIRYTLLAAIYFIIAAAAIFNHEMIVNGILSSWHSLSQIREISHAWAILRESFLLYSGKLAASPLLLVGLLGATILIWTFSILRLREITK